MEKVQIQDDGFSLSIKYRIIYPNDSGSLGVIIPMHPVLTKEQIATKDVPEGKPFKIIDASELPEDTTFRDAWTFDFSKPDGYGMNKDLWYAENPPESFAIAPPIQEESDAQD